jgi:DNA-binding IclR family transcriptional regulator
MDAAEMNGEADRAPQNHRTIDRVTKILEEVVYSPGLTFSDLAQVLDAPKSSVHGLIRGLVAAGWLFEEKHRFYLGPAVYGLTLTTGHIRTGLVTDADLAALHEETGVTVFLGVRAGDHLIYVAETGSHTLSGFGARTDIRRPLLATAGGKALLAAGSEPDRVAYLRRRPPADGPLIEQFLADYDEIRRTGIASNTLHGGAQHAIATTVRNRAGEVVAEVTLVGPASVILPKVDQLSAILLECVDAWQKRVDGADRIAALRRRETA